ncbi:hypothetical protein [Gloeomargarita lithophora]|nr:hypothetical protein [Gloeomargarita lithophora]
MVLLATATLPLLGQPQPLATQTARREQVQREQQRLQPQHYDLRRYPLTADQETHWRRLLWATALQQPQQPQVFQALRQILNRAEAKNLTPTAQKIITQALQVSNLYLRQYPITRPQLQPSLEQVVKTSPHPRWVALALNSLARSDSLTPAQKTQLITQTRQRFPQPPDLLQIVLQELAQEPLPLPPVEELLAWQAQPDQMQLYVFCQRNRWTPCTLIVKNNQGEFHREQGQMWSRPLLLQSVYGLDWAFTYGQTPQGLQRLAGITETRKGELFRAYGQFPLVKLFLPFEPGVKEFFPGEPVPTLAAYQERLPPRWRDYAPLHQSYQAGRLGRSLLRIHGTGDTPELFARPPGVDHAWNPALGCLTALELYTPQGELERGDMAAILRVLDMASGGTRMGYLLVVELPDSVGITLGTAWLQPYLDKMPGIARP